MQVFNCHHSPTWNSKQAANRNKERTEMRDTRSKSRKGLRDRMQWPGTELTRLAQQDLVDDNE